jgi:uncharacterized membrane protein YbaN (DUF454 family)
MGTFFLCLGTIGILIPILPTTPFLLLSVTCYYKGSEKLHNWILNNRFFGSYIRNYKEGKGIPLKTKFFTLTLLWISIFYTVVFVVNLFFIQLVLLIIAIIVSLHVIKLPTTSK